MEIVGVGVGVGWRRGLSEIVFYFHFWDFRRIL